MWEAGRALPEPETILSIAAFFGVTTDYLLDLTDTFPQQGWFRALRIIGTVKADMTRLA
jgi:transcriptional regulator with XRE-family HTH domain